MVKIKEMDKNLAVTKAGEMFYNTILSDIPKEAIEYLTYLSKKGLAFVVKFTLPHLRIIIKRF